MHFFMLTSRTWMMSFVSFCWHLIVRIFISASWLKTQSSTDWPKFTWSQLNHSWVTWTSLSCSHFGISRRGSQCYGISHLSVNSVQSLIMSLIVWWTRISKHFGWDPKVMALYSAGIRQLFNCTHSLMWPSLSCKHWLQFSLLLNGLKKKRINLLLKSIRDNKRALLKWL